MDSREELIEALDTEGSGVKMIEKPSECSLVSRKGCHLLGRDFDSLLSGWWD